jgi:acyl carrier protein
LLTAKCAKDGREGRKVNHVRLYRNFSALKDQTNMMTEQTLYAEISPLATEILQIPEFNSGVNMTSTPEWDSLAHVQLLSAIEKKFAIEVSPDDAFKLTSADRLVQYLHAILKDKR